MWGPAFHNSSGWVGGPPDAIEPVENSVYLLFLAFTLIHPVKFVILNRNPGDGRPGTGFWCGLQAAGSGGRGGRQRAPR